METAILTQGKCAGTKIMRIHTNTHYFQFMYLLVVPGHVLVVRLLAAELLLALTAIPLLLLCCVAFKVTFHLGLVFECSVTPWMWACDCGLLLAY